MTAAFLGLEAALYAAFMTLDLTGGSGDLVKYASIAVCLVFSVLFARRGGSRLMAAAMALTLGADTFLLLLNDWYGAGVALFCGVQGLYLIRILRRCGRSLWGLRLFLVGAAWAGLWALGLLSPLNLLAAVYFANFLVNACQALSLSMPLFAWGLWLFLLCDVCVGVHNQPELFPEWLAAFAQVGMWLFYLPGQVLLVLSGRKRRIFHEEAAVRFRGLCHGPDHPDRVHRPAAVDPALLPGPDRASGHPRPQRPDGGADRGGL